MYYIVLYSIAYNNIVYNIAYNRITVIIEQRFISYDSYSFSFL